MPYFVIALVVVLANGLLWFTSLAPLQLLGAGALFCFLPGFLLVGLLLPRSGHSDGLERVLLSVGASYFLGTLVLLIIHFLPGPVSLLSLLLGLDLLIALLLVLCFVSKQNPGWPTFNALDTQHALIALVLLLATFCRFGALGHSEYQGDEIDVTSLAQAAISGQDDAFFWHKKGPAELAVATAFALFTGGFDEFALRFPFALASALAVLAAFLVASRMFNQRVAGLAGLLLAIEGVTLGFSRMVQYHGVVVLALTLAFYCLYRLNRVDDGELADRYQLLGAGFFAFSLLAHYEAALMGLPLLFLYCQRYGRRFLKDNGGTLLLCAGLVVIVLAAYYVPFVLHPHFAQTFETYTTIRISPERGPYNNLPDYFVSNVFYNAIYYVVTMTALLIVACVESVWRGLRPKGLAAAILLLLVIGLMGSILFPSLLTLGGVKYSLFLFLPFFITLWLGKGMGVERRAVFMWFFSYLIFYAFIIRVPGLHYYCLSPAWAILAALGVERRIPNLPRAESPRAGDGLPIRRSAMALSALTFAAIAVVYALSAFYTYILFVRTDPEYALSYPQHRIPLYWNTHQERPLRFFGLPHKSGWKTIGYLVGVGVLQGDYRTNEKSEVAGWYTGQEPSQAERPRYYFIAENPTQKEHKQDAPKELLQSEYRVMGTVTVGGRPRLHIYELKELTAQASQVTHYEADAYEPLYNQVFAVPK
jgi:4-amino-4-deoxy-L-arabinose transferase-like glycosyltransferase